MKLQIDEFMAIANILLHHRLYNDRNFFLIMMAVATGRSLSSLHYDLHNWSADIVWIETLTFLKTFAPVHFETIF
jgi:hypothetical protein